MVKKHLLRKGAAYLLSAAMVLTSNGIVPWGVKTASAANVMPDITTGLVAYYPFDNTLDNTVSGGIAGKAKLHGGAGPTWGEKSEGDVAYGTGKKGKAFKFNGGANGEDGNNGLMLDVKTGESFTISAWVNTEEKINYQPIFFAPVDFENYVTAGTNYNDFASGGIVRYKEKSYWLDKNNNCSSSLQDLPLNTWTYITLTFDDSGKATLYYNGEVLSYQDIPDYVAGTYKEIPIYLGVNFWDNSFKGLMDNVSIYNRALSSDDVTALYAKENTNTTTPDIKTGLTAYYPLDNNLNNIVSNSKAKLHGGASSDDNDTWNKNPIDNVTYGTGKKGTAFEFNGGVKGADGNNGLELDVKTNKSFTISAWVNTAEKINFQPVFFAPVDFDNYVTSGTNYNDFASGGIVNYKTIWYWLDKNTSCSSSLQDLPLNTWTHIVLTFDDSGEAILYYNGEVLSQRNIPDYTSGTYENMPIYLGINFFDVSFKGLMDDVAVYNRALSPIDVAALYAEENADTSNLELTITAADNKTELTNSKYSEDNYNLDSVQLSAAIASQSLPMQCDWKVNEGAHATVDEAGLVKLSKDATDGEEITVTATNSYGVTGTIKLTVKVINVEVSVKSVTLDKQTASIYVDGTLTLNATVLPENASEKGITWSSSDETVAIVNQSGVVTALAAGTATITATSKENPELSESCVVTVTEADTPGGGDDPVADNEIRDESQLGLYRDDLAYKRVGVHDPSIVQDPGTKRYYLFGSHCAWAWSDDLENWTSFNNNITEGDNGSAHTIFEDEINWCKKANANYTVTGNLWAPDVIWDADYKNADGTTGAWLMYMSINGPKWNSTISLLTSDRLDGNWTYAGPVIQSGMSNGFGPTFDYEKVTGGTDVSRYTGSLSKGGNPTIEAHAIDPCVLYDDNGDLWMSYGSWSGGISMIKLDKETGLRDYNTTYADTNNTAGTDGFITDPYTGYKIAGGTAVSGEGSYIKKITYSSHMAAMHQRAVTICVYSAQMILKGLTKM